MMLPGCSAVVDIEVIIVKVMQHAFLMLRIVREPSVVTAATAGWHKIFSWYYGKKMLHFLLNMFVNSF